jgi:hypothetical protein
MGRCCGLVETGASLSLMLCLILVNPIASASVTHTAAPAVTTQLSKIHAVAPMLTNKEQVTQDFLDDLKAGKPRLLAISFEHSDVTQQAAALRQARHLNQDDDTIVEMEIKKYGALKTAVLSGYGNASLQIVRDYPALAQVLVRINSLNVLQRLVDDPRVSRVSSPLSDVNPAPRAGSAGTP